MKKDIFLTDKEMLEIVSSIPQNIKPNKTVTIFLQAECQAIARAQFTKLVSWLKQHNNCPVISEGQAFTLTLEDWLFINKFVEEGGIK